MTGRKASSSAAIRLDQFLKVQRVVATGGRAKLMIQSGEVLVNGQVETCRGRQLVVGDVVTVEGREFLCSSKEA